MVETLLDAYEHAIRAGDSQECAEQFVIWQNRVASSLEAAGMVDEHKIWSKAQDSLNFYADDSSFPAQAESMKAMLVGILGRLNEEESTEFQERLERGHPNISPLVRRMNHSLIQEDYPAVLHASASIFETLAKDIVNTPTIQNQTLGGFFDRYRKDSNLPDELLDYVKAIYDLRNTNPLAGHGSTLTSSLTRKEAVVLAEITKAFVRIEYLLREEPTQPNS